MAIESLMIRQPIEVQLPFQPGHPDVDEAVGVTLEAYSLLGYAQGNKDQTEHEVKTAFEGVANLGYNGRLIVPVPEAVTHSQLLAAAESQRPSGVPERYMFENLWVPGYDAQSYTEEELNQAPEKPLARIALFAANQSEVLDPILHFTGLPFDDYAKERWGGETTQKAEVEKVKASFAKEHEDFDLNMLNDRDFILMVLMDRIRGLKSGLKPDSKDFILNRGFMRPGEPLGRRAVRGDSYVGIVYSDNGQLGFVGSYGDDYWYDGVGLLAGQIETA